MTEEKNVFAAGALNWAQVGYKRLARFISDLTMSNSLHPKLLMFPLMA
ncbi:MAG: hypothetical protein JRJ47_04000 [Deltaproteobacteria bacterium]|nr:hypothetical protein [Deltaproteobacteria bacterium]